MLCSHRRAAAAADAGQLRPDHFPRWRLDTFLRFQRLRDNVDTRHQALDTEHQTRGGCVIKIANMLWPQLQSYRAKDSKIFAVWGWIVPDSFLCVWEFYHIFSIVFST